MEQRQELSIKSIIIGVILAMALCGANIYLGLKIGTTISASIPASILSFGLLRMFKKYSILENNISQTIASSGEALAGVFAFVLPSALILGIWHEFPYWQEFIFGLCGGFVGIIYSILLRKVLLGDKDLTFPEGQAIGKVLLATNKANAEDTGDFKILLKAIGIAGLINFCQNGLKVLSGSYFKVVKIAGGLMGASVSFSPAVFGAGFLIGGGTFVAFLGMVISWLILLPYFTLKYGIKDPSDLVSSAFFTWKEYIRPVGIGVFLFGGVSTILMMFKSITAGIKESLYALVHLNDIHLHERDLNIKKLFIVFLLSLIPIIIFIYMQIAEMNCCGQIMIIGITFLVIFIVLILGFMVAAVAGYLVGMVGSSNSPISGLYFVVVIFLCVILKLLVGASLSVHVREIMYIVIMLVSFIGFAGVITNENIQDYKSGSMVGATPYKQQISLFIGVVASILIAPLMINLVFNAYGIGGVVPHVGINPNNTLSAPQASAIASIIKHILNGSASWGLIGFGMFIGFVAFLLNLVGKKTGKFSFSPVMVAIGLYLPADLVTLLFVGGLLRIIVNRRHAKIAKVAGQNVVESLETSANILVCGLIAGESLMGLILAVPFVIKQSSNALSIVGPSFSNFANALSFIVTLILLAAVYRVATKYKVQ